MAITASCKIDSLSLFGLIIDIFESYLKKDFANSKNYTIFVGE